VTQSSPKSEKPAPDLWGKDTETNPVTGVVSKNASLDYIDGPGLHVRQIGKVRECYVITRRFLETTSNMYSRRSAVAYRFDDGRPVKQSWIIGDSNDTLFYPGKDCTPFIRQVMKSQTLAFQYEPAETIPTVATFDLRGFPSGFFDLPQ
jgi:hypothetical protein